MRQQYCGVFTMKPSKSLCKVCKPSLRLPVCRCYSTNIARRTPPAPSLHVHQPELPVGNLKLYVLSKFLLQTTGQLLKGQQKRYNLVGAWCRPLPVRFNSSGVDIGIYQRVAAISSGNTHEIRITGWGNSLWLCRSGTPPQWDPKHANNAQNNVDASSKGRDCWRRVRGENGGGANVQERRPRLPQELYHGAMMCTIYQPLFLYHVISPRQQNIFDLEPAYYSYRWVTRQTIGLTHK